MGAGEYVTITEGAQLLTALAVAINAISSFRNGRKIEAVHIATNSLTDRLVETTRTEAHAAGVKEGRES